MSDPYLNGILVGDAAKAICDRLDQVVDLLTQLLAAQKGKPNG